MQVGFWLCLGGAAIGLTGLIGWISGTAWLTTLVPGLPAMMPNTALALLVIGGAGAMRQQEKTGPVRVALSMLAALAVLTMGAGTLAEYVFGIELRILRISQVFVRSLPALSPAPSSPFTALALTFLATGILLLNVGSNARARPSELLAVGAALTAFTGLTGIILRADPLYRLMGTPAIGISLPTAISLLLISIGLLAGPARAGIVRVATSAGPGGNLVRRLALPVIAVPILLGLVITRVAELQGIVEVALPVAILSAAMTAVSLGLLLVSALPLNRAHEEVQTAHTRMSQLVEHAPDGIFVADIDGRYTDVNEAGCRLLGHTREEILSKTIVDLIPASDVGRLWQAREALLRGEVQVEEWTLRRHDGSLLPVEISAKILSDGRWQGFVRDISERKRLSREAQRAAQVRDEVLGIVAHDLRNPLSTILIEARLLEERGREPERHSDQPGQRIERAAMRMSRLIEDLLEVTRIEAGRLMLEQSSTPGAQAVTDAADAQRALASSASLELRLELSSELPEILADRDRLLQVFENLIGNAIQFTPPGGCITLGAAQQQKDVLFWVKDTGPGIPPDDHPHLFDRFWQARTAKRRGAGLGLPIVKGIIEAHGGRVWVESALGSGTTFFFTIPIAPRAVTGTASSRR